MNTGGAFLSEIKLKGINISDRVPTGMQDFDELIEGGFPKYSTILLAGNPGAGKTVFSAKFIYEGVRAYDEPGTYVCLNESRDKFLSAMRRFGMDFEPLINKGLVTILDLSLSMEIEVQAALNQILEAIASIGARRLVIDSLTALLSGMKSNLERRYLTRLIYKLCKKAGCTAIVIIDTPFWYKGLGFGVEEFIADGIIFMRSIFKNGILTRQLRILKMRETKHSLKTHIYVLSDSGLKILQTSP